VQATTVGAQAHAAGKQVLGLAFSPLVQRSGMDYAKLGMGAGVPDLEALPELLAQALAAVRHGSPGTEPRTDAAQRVAREIAALAAGRPEGPAA
jgi:hypothetical protein